MIGSSSGGSGSVEERPGRRGAAGRGSGAGEQLRVEAPRAGGAQRARRRSSAGPTAAAGGGGRSTSRARPTVGRCARWRRSTSRSSLTGTAGGSTSLVRASRPGVGDDERVAGGEHRVEQELAVLGPAVVVAEVAGSQRAGRRRRARRRGGRRRRRGRRGTRPGGARTASGTSVHIVRSPVRNAARVGWPRRRSARRSRISASRSGGPPPAAGLVLDLGQQPVELGPLPGVGGPGVEEQVGGGVDRRHPSASGRGSVRSRTASPRRPTSSAKRPARSMSPESTSSSGRTPPTSRWSSSDIATPSRRRCRPASHVPVSTAARSYGRPVGAVEAPAGAGRLDPAGDRARGRRRRSRTAGGPAAARRRPAPARR